MNSNAGRKPPLTKGREKRTVYPDSVTSMKKTATKLLVGSNQGTVGKLLQCQAKPSSDPLRIAIRRSGSKLQKLVVAPTTSTPFQLINITCKINKCAGYRRDLKAGPDKFSHHDLDETLCIRHDAKSMTLYLLILQTSGGTFGNKHYHVFLNCVRARYSAFGANSEQITLNYSLGVTEITFLKERIYSGR